MSNDFVERVKNRFHLDKDNGWIFGVCAGLANTLHLDAAIVRVGVVVTGLFFPKLVIAAYLVIWLVLDDRSVFKQ